MRSLWQVPTFFAGLLALSVVSGEAALQGGGGGSDPGNADLAQVRRLLLDPRSHTDTLLDLAEKAVANAAPEQRADASFLLGMAQLRMAERSGPDKARELQAQAIDRLEQAEHLGIPEQDQPRLCYGLGRALFLTGGDVPRCIAYLNRCLPLGGDAAADAYRMLALAYLRLPEPDLDKADVALQRVLATTQDEKVRLEARVERGDVLARKGLYLDALKVLDGVDGRATPELRLKARLLQVRCCEEEKLWARAVPLWQELQQTPAAVPGGLGSILYKLGLCYRHSEPPDLAAAARAWEGACEAGGEEGQAAGLLLARLRLDESPPALSAAAIELARALVKTNTPDEFHNKLTDLGKVRDLFEAALKAAREARDSERTVQLSQLYGKVALPGVAPLRLAEAAEGWARDLQQKVKQGDPDAAPFAQQAARQFQVAGAAYESAAAADGQGDYLWRGAACYRQGKDDARAVELLDRFVRLPLPPEKQAEGWFALAEAHWALQRKDEARQAYYKCIEYPSSPYAYRARYQLARDKYEQEQLPAAQEILEQNLILPGVALDREAHEGSLYLLGAVLFHSQKYDKAAVKLKEATSHYPDNPEVLRARFRLGECHRKIAEQYRDRLKAGEPATLESQANIRLLMQQNLEQAGATYMKLVDELQTRGLARSLSPFEEQVLRRSWLALADVQYDQGNFVEALRGYRKLGETYPRQIEILYACWGCWRCFAVMEPQQSLAALEAARALTPLAKAHLPEIPEEQFRSVGGGTTRQQWEQRINDYAEQLQKIPTTPTPPGP